MFNQCSISGLAPPQILNSRKQFLVGRAVVNNRAVCRNIRSVELDRFRARSGSSFCASMYSRNVQADDARATPKLQDSLGLAAGRVRWRALDASPVNLAGSSG